MGVCCESGLLDRCGICDGGDGGCAVEVHFTVQVAVTVAASDASLGAVGDQVRSGVCVAVGALLSCDRVVLMSVVARPAVSGALFVDVDIVVVLLAPVG
jgi:hypothetical protein